MPIKIHDSLPARKVLLKESVDVIDSSSAEKQDIRPLKFLLLNLMPHKLQTEVQFARILGASPLQIELTLMTTETYSPKNTKKDHLLAFYKNLELRDVKINERLPQKSDGNFKRDNCAGNCESKSDEPSAKNRRSRIKIRKYLDLYWVKNYMRYKLNGRRKG